MLSSIFKAIGLTIAYTFSFAGFALGLLVIQETMLLNGPYLDYGAGAIGIFVSALIPLVVNDVI